MSRKPLTQIQRQAIADANEWRKCIYCGRFIAMEDMGTDRCYNTRPSCPHRFAKSAYGRIECHNKAVAEGRPL